ncbi:MAG: CsgG/HfaB family protein [Acidobacteriota bacterium]
MTEPKEKSSSHTNFVHFKNYLSAGLAMTLVVVLAQSLVGWAAPPKRRVAVLDFEFGAVHRWWDGHWDIGKGISDLIVDQLVRDGTFSVIERRKLDAVLAEQNFSNSANADSTTAATLGRVLGVNAIILGSVTQFGTERRDFNTAGVGGGRRGLGGGRVGTQEGKANVAVTARLIDVNTGEILASATGLGKSSRGGLLLGGLVIGGGGFGAGGLSMSSSQFRETILGEATYAAVQELSRRLVLFSHKVSANPAEIRGLIADVNGSSVVLNVGSSHGVVPGTTLRVVRVNRVVKDPATGKPLREVTEEVGTIRVDEADAISSVGAILNGQDLRVGDLVRN